MIIVSFIRHAESNQNLNPERVCGRSNDSDLTEKGLRQCYSLLERLRSEGKHFEIVYSSPAIRTINTAKFGVPHTTLIESDSLQELDQGEFTRQLRTDVFTPYVKNLFDTDPWNFQPPKGESRRETGERMYSWLQEKVNSAQDNQEIVVVGHSVAIKCLLKILFGLPQEFIDETSIIRPTSITTLSYDRKKWELLNLGDYTHLPQHLS